MLSRDVRAKDLGLLIVDEEQRFGVKQKELLRQLKLRVDVISMSATPIPRTLQMSLAGLREISVIETPPEGRRPVKTYVGEYEEELVKRAILREHERDGQAFFLHNRVESIDETAERLRALCPGVRFAVAHGQMTDGELETVMMDYLRGESDVLVCTSIIESGIDIPQANTLIVEHADAFGLSQLYQIRGRVGRSRERAYAYLLYDSAAALTPEAAQRLAALSDYTELGAGFKIAMRDLELRGAGNLLGDEQSGHVAALGFELYMQMLDEAVRGAGRTGMGRAAPREELPEPVRLDVNVDAYIPADYVPYEQAKIEIHRRVAGALEVAEVEQLREELEDRFGPVPEPLANLLALQRARIKFGQAGAGVSFRGERLGGHADRAGLRTCAAAARAAARGAVRVRALAGLRAGAARGLGAVSDGRQGRRRAARAHARGGLRCVFEELLKHERRRYPLECPRRVQVLGSISALGAVFFAVIGLAACGGGIPGNAVVQVNGTPITKTTFEHWMSVASASTASSPGTTGAKPAIPVPPDYTACIAHLEATAPKPAKGQAKPTSAQLKSECEQQYKSLQQEVLGFLISSSWVLGEAESLGVKVSDAGSQERIRKDQERAVPQGRRIPEIPRHVGPDASRICCCA